MPCRRWKPDRWRRDGVGGCTVKLVLDTYRANDSYDAKAIEDCHYRLPMLGPMTKLGLTTPNSQWSIRITSADKSLILGCNFVIADEILR